jgi:hypothetical protein
MTTRVREAKSDLEAVRDLLDQAVTVMSRFPNGFVPPDIERPGQQLSAADVFQSVGFEDMLRPPEVQQWLHAITNTWPDDFAGVFIRGSRMLAHIVSVFGPHPPLGFPSLEAMTDRGTLELMSSLVALAKDRRSSDPTAESGQSGFEQVMVQEIQRRSLARRIPFARTLVTLLGRDALLWLTASSADGLGKIQPHEFSRTGWPDLWSMEAQLAIEHELLRLSGGAEPLGRMAVALGWTLAAMASFVTPDIFVGEALPHLTSRPDGNYTMSTGRGTHSLISFDTASMLVLVRILAAGLDDPLLTPADLMWMSAAVARVRHIQVSAATTKLTPPEETFRVFLSHRGRDSKRQLSYAARHLGARTIFLDCLTMPRGVINRRFIYESLARSSRVVIVDSDNFHESVWCRKESWFAHALADHKLTSVEHTSVDDAVSSVTMLAPPGDAPASATDYQYPIANRILRDIDYFGRQPNLYSLKEHGHSCESLDPLQDALSTPPRPDDSAWVTSMATTIRRTLSQVVKVAPGSEPRDLWSSALQLTAAAFGSTSFGRSKMEVRAGVDRLNHFLKEFVDQRLHDSPAFRARPEGYLAAVAAAVTIGIAGFHVDPRMLPAIDVAARGAAIVNDGILLLDARQPGPVRDFRLRLVAALARSSIGGVGLVQDADDQVHLLEVDGQPLETLPCITLYPDMDWIVTPALSA